MKHAARAVLLLPVVLCAQLRIERFEPTVLFPRGEPLRQLAWLHVVHEAAQSRRCELSVRLSGSTSSGELDIPPGAGRLPVLVPDIASPAELELTVRALPAGPVLATHRCLWQPQRKWKVFLVKSSHEDLGYEDYIFKKQRDIAEFVDLARAISGPRDSEAPNYHYTLEHLLFQRAYIEERSEPAWREIVQDVLAGRLHLIGTPHGVHSHWMDYEELARMTYPGRRETRDRFGVDFKTFLIVDNPSLSWSGAQVVAQAGYRYVARWGQAWRTGGNNDYQTTKLPAVFWWLAPDGLHRVLFAWRSHYNMPFWFGQPRGEAALQQYAAEEVNRVLKAVESGALLGPYPYDALVNPQYTDHEIPFSCALALREWSRRYRYPEVSMREPTEFFEYLEKNFARVIPELRGDLNNFSGDYATIDPLSQGQKRQAARLLPLAEGLGAIAAALDPAFLPPAGLIARTFTRLFDYDEHSWPTLPRATDFHVFNAQYVKQHEARRALDAANQALETSFAALVKHIPSGQQPALMVFNPLAHPRTDLVEVPGEALELTDLATGRTLPGEAVGGGQTLFIAADVPAFGYRLYRVGTASPPASPPAALIAEKDRLANQFYELRFDPNTGAVRSIFDKELKRELVDPNAPWGFNQLVYLHVSDPPDYYRKTAPPELFRRPPGVPVGEVYSPSSVKALRPLRGPLRAAIAIDIEDARLGGRIRQEVILYDGLKRIDLVNRLEGIQVMHSDRYEDRYRDNLYYAFPLQVEPFEARVEYAGGVVRPFKDQLRWGSHDFLIANRWVDVSNKEFGVTMAPWEASTVSFGEIRYNRFSVDYQPRSSHIYSYAWSNRMAGLLTLEGADANATLRYSFTSHAGDWDQGAVTRFGWSVASPLLARRLPPGGQGSLPPGPTSLLSLSAPNVHLVTLKPSEQPGRGWVLRLVETEGKPTEVSLRAPLLPFDRAMQCNLVEDDQQPLTVEDRTVRLRVGPFAFQTVRLFASEQPPPRIENLRAEVLGDARVRIRWQPVKGAVYNIYRSEDPAAPATLYTLVGRSAAPEFLDQGLKPDTEYHYQVAAVSSASTQGPVSSRLSVRTHAENKTPPAPVDELGVVRRSRDRLIVYWRKNPEPDVARYHVFRSPGPVFDPGRARLAAVLRPTGYFLEIYPDSDLKAGQTYCYRVLAEDWAGNRQTESPTACASTPGR